MSFSGKLIKVTIFLEKKTCKNFFNTLISAFSFVNKRGGSRSKYLGARQKVDDLFSSRP